MSEWIKINSEKDLPPEGKKVLGYIINGNAYPHPVTLHRGISKKERELMRSGELPNPLLNPDRPQSFDNCKRSGIYRFCDEESNNTTPYAWEGDGPFQFFGFEVKFWKELDLPDISEFKNF